MNPSHGLDVAIVGMACRFPGASNTTEFWRNLEGGAESIHVFTDEELQAAGIDGRVRENASYVRARGVLDDVDRFDAAFFNVNPHEAELMDPQHRVFLECAWEALEDAGICPTQHERPIGIYAGAGPESYLLHLHANKDLVESVGGFQLSLGNDKDYLTTRVSYKLNLTGPSVTVQTACSSSLVAVHLAVQALLGGECDTALAGGAAIRLPQIAGYLYQEDGILSPDGHCRAFDRNAKGTVPGNGVGIVVLRRLSDAVADGQRVRAVIKGSAVVNDGSRRVGFTAPGVDGQVKAIRTALAVAGIAPDAITYVEAHGSGTPLGDRVELDALARVFRSRTRSTGRCALGSVKTNVGHLDTAAGVAGLIKTVLAIEHRRIPPSLHFAEPNPDVNLSATPFYVSTRSHEWTTPDGVLRAGVSSLGIGGTNVHLVLEEAPARVTTAAPTRPHVWLLSARTDTSLERVTDRLAEHLRQNPDLNGADVAYTLQIGRTHFPWRRVLVASDAADALRVLESRDPVRLTTELQPHADRPVAFLFPASGVGLDACRDLVRREPALRPYVERCAELFGPGINVDLLGGEHPSHGDRTADLAALFAVEYALAQLWQAWGVRPHAVSGFGVGACAAACTAGVLALDDAASLVATRDARESSQRLRAMRLDPPVIPCFSAVSHAWLDPSDAVDPQQWLPERHPGPCDVDVLRALAGGTERVVLVVGHVDAVPAQSGAPAPSAPTIVASLTAHEDEGRPDLIHVLGRLWQAGARVDWARCHASERRQRVPLPTYPFDRQRYWIDRPSSGARSDTRDRTTTRADPAAWLYVPTWKRAVRAQSPGARAGEPPRSWLVFRDAGGAAATVVDRLRQRGHRVVTVDAGAQFTSASAETYAIDPLRGDDYHRLLTDLRRRGGIPDVIVHAWSVDDDDARAGSTTSPDDRSYREFYSLLHLARALAATTQASHELCVVCRDVYDVAGTDTVSPLKATILGPCRVIPQECPGVSCRVIDIGPAADRSDDARDGNLADTLIDEITRAAAAPVVAYRGGMRWLQMFEPMHVPSVDVDAIPLRSRGVYLITGGLGAIGLTLAEHLAKSVQARLVLVGRSPFPGPSEWSRLESAADDIGVRARRLRAMQASGAEVLVFAADVADRDGMTRVVDETYRRYGAIHGVVHAAGLVGEASFRTIREASVDDCRRQFRAKVEGLRCLYELLKDRDVELWFLMSSLASVLGGVGFSAYAAANAFMDAFAARHRGARSRWLSVNWDTWRFREPGAPRAGVGSGSAIYSMSPDEGVDAFQRTFGLAEPQVVVSTGDLQARLDQWVHLTSLRAVESDAKTKRRHARPRLQTPYVAPTRGLECAIAALWQDLLGIDAIGVHDDFFELGGQSLLAIQLMNRIRETCGVQLPVRQVFQARTIADLSLIVAEGLAEQIDRRGLTSAVEGVLQRVRVEDAHVDSSTTAIT